MSELLQCPFCGGEAETLTAESMHGGYLYGIMCSDCRSRGDVYNTEAEAIAAWNSRADYHGYEQAAIEAWESIKAWNSRAERTCNLHGEWKRISQTQEVRHLYCDCGEHLGSDKRNLILECKADLPNYCPNCGCKVVGE